MGCLSDMCPDGGSGLPPRHVPWPGIELETFWFAGWCPTHWATPVTVIFLNRIARPSQMLPSPWQVSPKPEELSSLWILMYRSFLVMWHWPLPILCPWLTFSTDDEAFKNISAVTLYFCDFPSAQYTGWCGYGVSLCLLSYKLLVPNSKKSLKWYWLS